jgi:hypothetical protein
MQDPRIEIINLEFFQFRFSQIRLVLLFEQRSFHWPPLYSTIVFKQTSTDEESSLLKLNFSTFFSRENISEQCQRHRSMIYRKPYQQSAF